MPSFQDGAVIFVIALLLFGPKGLAKLAREAGKLMGEFRRASSEFRLQMEDEFRISEQADQQKKIAAMEAAAPVPPLIPSDIPEPAHPHMPLYEEAKPAAAPALEDEAEFVPIHIDGRPTPLPIASSGELEMMPPATGLPVARTASISSVFESIPHTADPAAHEPHTNA